MSSSWQQQQRYMTKNHILFFCFWWMFSKLSSFGSVGGVFIKYFAPPAQHTFTQAKQQKKLFLSTHNSDHKTLLTTLNKKKTNKFRKNILRHPNSFSSCPFFCFSHSQKMETLCAVNLHPLTRNLLLAPTPELSSAALWICHPLHASFFAVWFIEEEAKMLSCWRKWKMMHKKCEQEAHPVIV